MMFHAVPLRLKFGVSPVTVTCDGHSDSGERRALINRARQMSAASTPAQDPTPSIDTQQLQQLQHSPDQQPPQNAPPPPNDSARKRSSILPLPSSQILTRSTNSKSSFCPSCLRSLPYWQNQVQRSSTLSGTSSHLPPPPSPHCVL